MPRGHLVIRVKEAVGKNKAEAIVWDPNFIEGFVRTELRTNEGKKTTVQTQPKRVLANQLSWDEELRLEVNDSSKELRLMLCREKKTGTRVATSVIAACGIFVSDILEAVPIDKYFELFKPGAAGEGGFIRISITYEDHQRRKPQSNGGRQFTAKPPSLTGTSDKSASQKPKKGPLALVKLTVLAAAVGGAAVLFAKNKDGKLTLPGKK